MKAHGHRQVSLPAPPVRLHQPTCSLANGPLVFMRLPLDRVSDSVSSACSRAHQYRPAVSRILRVSTLR